MGAVSSDSTPHLYKYGSLLALVVQNASVVLFMRLSRLSQGSGNLYAISTAVFLAEFIKLGLSISLHYMTTGFKSVRQLYKDVLGDPSEACKMIIPAALYAAQNILHYVALSHIDAPSHQLLMQTRIFFTAQLLIFMLGHRLTRIKWFALTLLTIGAVISQYRDNDESLRSEELTSRSRSIGLCAVLATCFTSAFAGVYFEKVLKRTHQSLWVRNIQLAVFTSLISGLGGLVMDWNTLKQNGFWFGYNYAAVLSVLFNAIGGLVVATVVKYADNLVKNFAMTMSITISTLISAAIGDFIITMAFVFGGSLVVAATILYSIAPSAAPSCSDNKEQLLSYMGFHENVIELPFFTSDKQRRLLGRKPFRRLVVISLLLGAAFSVFPNSSTTTRGILHTDHGSICKKEDREKRRFNVSTLAQPRRVWEKSYHQWPIHPARPRNQFYTPPDLADPEPILTILTVTRDPSQIMEAETAMYVRQQSLQAFRWVIVNDYSTDPQAIDILRRLEACDPRFIVVNNTETPGVAGARNTAMKQVTTPYQVFLDDDDMWELVSLEQAVWLLEGNPRLHLAGFYVTYFGAQRGTFESGFHAGSQERITNHIHVGAIHRRSAVGECKFREDMNEGGEDYDFWICIANSGKWGATIPEYGYWYRKWSRRNRNWKLGPEMYAKAHQRWPDILRKPWPAHDIAPTFPFERIQWNASFTNTIAPGNGPAALILMDSYADQVSGRRVLGMAADLARRGWKISVVAFLNHEDKIRPEYFRYTHDVFVLPLFLRTVQYPAFISYLLQSRGIKTLIISESSLAYHTLPSLNIPQATAVIDYVHYPDGFGRGRFATLSAIHGRYISRTLALSPTIQNDICQRGRQRDSVAVLQRGVDTAYLAHISKSSKVRDRTGVADGCLVAYEADVKNDALVADIISALNKLSTTRKITLLSLAGKKTQEAVRGGLPGNGTSAVSMVEQEITQGGHIQSVIASADIVLALAPTATDDALIALLLGTPVVSTMEYLREDLSRELLGASPDSPQQSLHLLSRNISRNATVLAQVLLDQCSSKRVPKYIREQARVLLERTTSSERLEHELLIASTTGPDPEAVDPAAYYALAEALQDYPVEVDAHRQQMILPGYQAD